MKYKSSAKQRQTKKTNKSRNTFNGDGRVSLKHYKNPISDVSQPFFLLSRRDCLPQKSVKQTKRHKQGEMKRKEIERKEDRRNKDSQTDKKTNR